MVDKRAYTSVGIIADDFSGAAELAGISLRYGLKVEICLSKVFATDADVVIVCSDSRSMKVLGAKNATREALENVLKFNPSFVYKKIDSVLRGYVIEEIKLQMEMCNKSKVLICPANPSLNRTIIDGEYFIDGELITTTGFVNDPEFPVSSASVKAMINDQSVKVLKHTDALPDKGIVIAEASTADDINAWAKKIDDSWMLVGAADFYTAILEKNYTRQARQELKLLSPHLYVCGTAFEDKKQFIKKVHETKGCVAYLPAAVDKAWPQQAIKIIGEQKKLVIAIDRSNEDALYLRTIMSTVVNRIVQTANVKEIFIEGGSTAAAVLHQLKINKLTPVNELQRGVVRMKADDLFITVKPGSYQLPKEIAALYE